MRARMRGLVMLLGAVALPALAPAAGAITFSGTLSAPVVSVDGGTVTAQATMTSSCVVGEYCGFFPVVTTVAQPQPCAPTITGSDWVGSVVFGSYGDLSETLPATAISWREWPTLYSGPKTACLYAEGGSSFTPTLVAQEPYTVPAPAPAPVVMTPAPAPVAPATTTTTTTMTTETVPIPDLPFLSRADAVAELKRWIRHRYGHRWTLGRGRTSRCPVRSSTAQLGCVAAWVYRHRVYSKSIVLTVDDYGDFTVSRDFASAPAQTETIQVPVTTTTPGTSTTSDDFCATHDCIPNYPNGTGTTVMCSDGTYSHSGGKQGACSHHGGEADAVVPRRDVALARATLRVMSRRLSASRR